LIILYTDHEAGEWIPFNTPVSMEDIRAILDRQIPTCLLGNHVGRVRVSFDHICLRAGKDDDTLVFVPQSDVLPVFHSILLPTATRWDVVNRRWASYICDTLFKEWWVIYIEHYESGETEPKRWWLDQGQAIDHDPRL